VGGANSACDAALECWQKGANVTMVVRDNSLYQKVKYWILPNIENRIAEGSIKAYFNSNILEIKEDKVDILTPEGQITIDNDYVLAMTGYLPDFVFLESIGIKFSVDNERIPIYNETNLESNKAGIYLAGVILSGTQTSKLFIENTRHHGKIIIDNIVKTSV
jgi:thioredoxin reductase (NADPH)